MLYRIRARWHWVVANFRRWRVRRMVNRLRWTEHLHEQTDGGCEWCLDAARLYRVHSEFICIDCWARDRLGYWTGPDDA